MRQDNGSAKRGHSGRPARAVRPVNPSVSVAGEDALDRYGTYLRDEEDLSASTVRNYLSDLRHFAAWCEATWEEGQEQEAGEAGEGGEAGQPFTPSNVSTPTITRYRSYLQTVLRLKPASINRSLVTLKRYFYSPDGYMSVLITGPDRPAFKEPDIGAGTGEELARAAATCIAYCGRYEVLPGRVVHYVENSLFPNWVGTIQERFMELEGSILTLSTAPLVYAGQQRRAHLIWQRVGSR